MPAETNCRGAEDETRTATPKQPMRSLITGIGGFAGGHLAAALVARGDPVAGYTLPHPRYPQLEPFRDRIRIVEGDVRDAAALNDAMAEARPEVVYHLAAITHVGHSWDQRRTTLETNVLGTATVLEAAASLEPPPRVLLASTGLVYGAAARDGMPLPETAPARPLSPYAASKRCAEVLLEQAWQGEGMCTIVVRTFNHTGPWQSPDFVCSDFARQVAWAEAGLGPREITVGDLEARRDFSDVRDMVEGYILAGTRGEPGSLYNLASGRAVRVGDVLDRLMELARVPLGIRRDPQRLRPSDVPALVGDASRARRELGWQPRIPLQQTLEEVLEFWRGHAAASGTSSAGR